MHRCLLLAILILVPCVGAADELGLEATHRELEEMNRLEQRAFIDGDCDALAEFLADDVTFYMNGRKVPKAGVLEFCEHLPRPFPGSPDENTTFVALAPDAGYVVKVMKFPERGGIEVVTKIWGKQADGWKIRHFQSTVLGPQQGRPPPKD